MQKFLKHFYIFLIGVVPAYASITSPESTAEQSVHKTTSPLPQQQRDSLLSRMVQAESAISLLESEEERYHQGAISLTPQQQLDRLLTEVMHVKSQCDDMKALISSKGLEDKELQDYFKDFLSLSKKLVESNREPNKKLKNEHYIYLSLRSDMCCDFDLVEYIFEGVKYIKGNFNLESQSHVLMMDISEIHNFYQQICYIVEKAFIDLRVIHTININQGLIETPQQKLFYYNLFHIMGNEDNEAKFHDVFKCIALNQHLLTTFEKYQYNTFRFYYNVKEKLRAIGGFNFGIQNIGYKVPTGEHPDRNILDALYQSNTNNALLATIIRNDITGTHSRLPEKARRRIYDMSELNKSLHEALYSNTDLINRFLIKVFPGYKNKSIAAPSLGLASEPQQTPKKLKGTKVNKKKPQPTPAKKKKSRAKSNKKNSQVNNAAAVDVLELHKLDEEVEYSPTQVPIVDQDVLESTIPLIARVHEDAGASDDAEAEAEAEPVEQIKAEQATAVQEPEEDYTWDYDEWFNHYIAPFTNSTKMQPSLNKAENIPERYVLERRNSKAALFLDVVLGRVAYTPLNIQHFNAFLQATCSNKVKMIHNGYIPLNFTDRSVETKYALKNFGTDQKEHRYKIYTIHQPHGSEEFPKRTLFNFFKRHLEATGYRNVYLQ